MDYYLKDGHIWDCIKIYESAQICQKKYYLDCLIYQLEYLLKYDWERSKSEVLINIWLSISILCSVGGLACLVVANWPNVQGGKVDIEFLFTSTLVAIFITLCPYLYVKKILSDFQFKLFSFFAIIFLILLGALSFLYPDKEIWFGMSALCFFAGIVLNFFGATKSKSGIDNDYVRFASKLMQEIKSPDTSSVIDKI